MKSQWFKLKDSAISLRKKGFSIKSVEKKLGISRSTLSGWFKDIELTNSQKERLLHNWKTGLIAAQRKGSEWHREQGIKRRMAIREDVERFMPEKNLDKRASELILTALYLAEGSKKESSFAIANSNSEILKGVINLLRQLYPIDESKFRCSLHLRNDQNEETLKKYWSKLLSVPESQFHKTQFDKRTVKKTYDHYKGVCVLYYHDMALQRRILYLGEKILNIVNTRN